jgi:hypothetical protein
MPGTTTPSAPACAYASVLRTVSAIGAASPSSQNVSVRALTNRRGAAVLTALTSSARAAIGASARPSSMLIPAIPYEESYAASAGTFRRAAKYRREKCRRIVADIRKDSRPSPDINRRMDPLAGSGG